MDCMSKVRTQIVAGVYQVISRTLLSWVQDFQNRLLHKKNASLFIFHTEENAEEFWTALGIKLCTKLVKTASETLEVVKTVYEEAALLPAHVFRRWHKTCKDGGKPPDDEDCSRQTYINNRWKCGCYQGCSESGLMLKCQTNHRWGRNNK